ncbi:glycosyltransferase family 4 protein [Aromatoleum evansii]|uniref:Glycosyltransferase family 4 protein n=1 Tax=Aromatoleum evansii TaxID=59406 RepID=A0ABZ1AI63_AROEV|nr:glycosyltransferase family 4 protein [Aromatoleum evansii]
MNWAGKRIALIGPLPPPAGGMANQTRQLAELLGGEGLDVDLVQTNAPYCPQWIGHFRGVRAGFRLMPYLLRLWAAAGRADVMHVMANSGWSWHLFAAPAVWIAHLRRVPVVVNYRGGEADDFLARSARWVCPTLRRAAGVLVPSGFLRDVFLRHGVESRIVPNVVDVARFHADARPRCAGDAPHVVVARNLEPIYGISTALEAFAQIRAACPRARMSVAGTGPQADELIARAAALGLDGSVRFTGRLERDEMAALYRDADVVLNPARVDNMPNSVLEALASGVPVVSTDVGGVPYIVENGRSALLVPRDDAAAMAAAVLHLVRSPELGARLVEGGLHEVRRYTWAEVRHTLFSAYEAALRGAVAPAGAR